MAEPRVVTFFDILSNEMIEIICFIFLLGIMHVFLEATTDSLPAIFDSSSSSSSTIFSRSKGFFSSSSISPITSH